MTRLEAIGRVGWAKWYAEVRHSEQLAVVNNMLIERIETLVPELLELTDDVLHERNVKAFQRAYKIRALVEQYQR